MCVCFACSLFMSTSELGNMCNFNISTLYNNEQDRRANLFNTIISLTSLGMT
jgi:hypothetical protein